MITVLLSLVKITWMPSKQLKGWVVPQFLKKGKTILFSREARLPSPEYS